MTLGRSDLVRRAMSKKKADVMAKEREILRLWKRRAECAGMYCQWD